MAIPSIPSALYNQPVVSSRIGELYNAFPYPTKIAPDAVALFVAAHTRVGDTVFDGFAGSGTTALGALLCAAPSLDLQLAAGRAALTPDWGPRRVLLVELGVLGSLVSQVLTNPPLAEDFVRAARSILQACEARYSWLYQVRSPNGELGTMRHAIWSEVIECPHCKNRVSQWSAVVSRAPARIAPTFVCQSCGGKVRVATAQRVIAKRFDDLIGGHVVTRDRHLAFCYGTFGKAKWSREPSAEDLELLHRIDAEPIPETAPVVPMRWGDLHRSGYHLGITHVHHFYTRRNFIAMASLWDAANAYAGQLGNALRLWILSYNQSHSTLMTRVAAKSGMDDLVVTSAQSGVLYVGGLPLEKNVFLGLRRRVDSIASAFSAVNGLKGRVDVINASCTAVPFRSGSVDYVFTDPPFGGFIPYSELSFINEAWLGHHTASSTEAIISPAQHKGLKEYESLLTASFSEVSRILKPGGRATVVFHSSSAAVWGAFQAALRSNGFSTIAANILHKTQESLRQLKDGDSVRGDVLLLLERAGPKISSRAVDETALAIIEEGIVSGDEAELDPKRLYGRFVSRCLESGAEVKMDASEFYRLVRMRYALEPVDESA